MLPAATTVPNRRCDGPAPRRRSHAAPRVELFAKSLQELEQRAAELSRHGVRLFNVPNKNKGERLGATLAAVRRGAPGSHVALHYSLKYNKAAKRDGGADVTYGRFADAVGSLAGQENVEVLLISGSGDKKDYDAVAALQRLKQQRSFFGGKALPPIGVAFNPYFADAGAIAEERRRLEAKLSTGLVSSVWLQFGSDAGRLRDELAWLRGLSGCPERIVGSLFLPTKKLIAQQRFRPWNGVFLSPEYLGGPEGAERLTRQLLSVYERHGVQVLAEAPGVRSEADLRILDGLLAPAAPAQAQAQAQAQAPAQAPPPGAAAASQSAKRMKTASGTAVVLFGAHDLRLHDNPAFLEACTFDAVVPAFLWSEAAQGRWGVRGAYAAYVREALRSLAASLEGRGLKLILRECASVVECAASLAEECSASAVFYNREHTPEAAALDAELCRGIGGGAQVRAFEGTLLYAPQVVAMQSGFNGGHWGTLMPFLKTCQKTGEPPRCRAAPARVGAPGAWPASQGLEELSVGRMPTRADGSVVDWGKGIRDAWPVGEAAAMDACDAFVATGLKRYEKDRSRADLRSATARVSVYLRSGELSPRHLYHAVRDAGLPREVTKTFARRLHWRDLAYFHLASFPAMREVGIRRHYDGTAWAPEPSHGERLDAWRRGRTGYPMVDAGMRQLRAEGWMPQTVRMVCASFLVEYLRVRWQDGMEHFHEELVDADSAINAMMWQNCGRSGIDQWNFVLSPTNASQDPSGAYCRAWLPELRALPRSWLHRPWEAPPAELEKAGVVLGETYPHRIVEDLGAERAASRAAVLRMRQANQRFNDAGGYDLIELPGGSLHRVFTKQEYRIDRDGKLKPPPPRRNGGGGRSKARGGRGRPARPAKGGKRRGG